MITIDSNKILNIDGKKTFPVGIYNECSIYPEQVGLAGPCTPSNNKEFLFGAETEYNLGDITKYKTQYENAGLYYTLFVVEILETGLPWNLINGQKFFGYYQMDEPSSDDVSSVSAAYNSIKSQDVNHPVILNAYTDMMTWYRYTDVLTWDSYPFLNDYTIGDAMYVYEIQSDYNFFKGSEVNSIGKPVWAVLQANGVPYTLSGMGSTSFLVPTPAQIRLNTYTALTTDAKGIVFWGYIVWGDNVNVQLGLSKNSSLHSSVKQISTELRSFNDWLVSPTVDYSWGFRVGKKITFDKVISRHIDQKQFTTNWNYILKNYNGTYYLIVVNKEPKPIPNVTITISGLSGSLTATTIGIETQGSGRAGRNVPVSNGTFTDSFDGNVVHIYQIGGSPVPVLSSIQVSPTSVNMTVGKTVQLTAICKDQSGSSLTCPTLTWKSSNKAIATVSSSGLVTGIAVGNANITASAAGKTSNPSGIKVTVGKKFTVQDVTSGNPPTKIGVKATLDNLGTFTKDGACTEVCNRLGQL